MKIIIFFIVQLFALKCNCRAIPGKSLWGDEADDPEESFIYDPLDAVNVEDIIRLIEERQESIERSLDDIFAAGGSPKFIEIIIPLAAEGVKGKKKFERIQMNATARNLNRNAK